ncbi:MAG TPA: 1,4-dihydroxy-2-naphthoate octaprenyltransferase [Gammaproteobacteria bacterium]|nr:1,4-dihydroxy-2-naphthoate octaprenyltransferase [Gammaproteobacteria bacterium]
MKTWLLAIRPKTLSLAVVPVLVGTALAWAEWQTFHWGPLLATLGAALLIQIGTNLHNDVADYERGADTPQRLGPQRATAEGWLGARQVRRAAHLAFATAFVLGIYLVWLGGWPIAVLGLLSLAAGYAYTGGPRPLAYTPLGELFVWLFFGIAAVTGSAWLQGLQWSWLAPLTGAAVGLPAAAVLMVNNYRDLDTDREAGKHTLAVTLGRPAVRWLYAAALCAPPLVTLALRAAGIGGAQLFLPWLALPPALVLVRQLWRAPIDAGLNRLLAATARWQLLFGGLLCLALVL